MDQKRKNYSITCFKKSEGVNKTFYLIVFLEMCKSFQLMPKGLVARKIFCVGGNSKKFQKKWDCNLKETEIKCRDLLLEEYCSKLLSLMDSFWVDLSGKHVDLCWLVRFRGHSDKVEKEEQRIKQKKSSTLSSNSSLKKWFLSDLMNIFLTFSLRQTFYRIAALNVQNLKISTLSPH